MTLFGNPLADPLGIRCGSPLIRGPQFENRWRIRLRVGQNERLIKVSNNV